MSPPYLTILFSSTLTAAYQHWKTLNPFDNGGLFEKLWIFYKELADKHNDQSSVKEFEQAWL